jgi:tRNA1Val (adenine37-N6)-methyltransferase
VAQRLACAPWLFLLEGRRGGKPGLSVEPLFVVEEEPGIYSSEMRAIYEPGREEDN